MQRIYGICKRVLVMCLLLIVCLPLLTSSNYSLDPLNVSPDTFDVLLENKKVRVLSVIFEPGEAVGFHDHPPFVIYGLSPCRLKIGTKDGKYRVLSIQESHAIYLDEVIHEVKNMSRRHARFLIIEMRCCSESKDGSYGESDRRMHF